MTFLPGVSQSFDSVDQILKCYDWIRCDEGKTPQTSALESLYGGQIMIKQNIRIKMKAIKENFAMDFVFFKVIFDFG